VITIEQLKDVLGIGVMKAEKAKNQVNSSLLPLTRSHQIILKSFESGVDAIIPDEILCNHLAPFKT